MPLSMHLIELLESRIAPAVISFTYTDVDGDIVTVSSSKGVKADLQNAANFDGTGHQLQRLDLSTGTFGGEFEGADISIVVTTQALFSGDGHVNVGFIDATGRNLGIVTVDGDLGRIAAGTGTATPAVTALNAISMGALGTSTQA